MKCFINRKGYVAIELVIVCSLLASLSAYVITNFYAQTEFVSQYSLALIEEAKSLRIG